MTNLPNISTSNKPADPERDALAIFRSTVVGIAAAEVAADIRAKSTPYTPPRPSWGTLHIETDIVTRISQPVLAVGPVSNPIRFQNVSRGPAAPANPRRLNAPLGRSQSSLDTVRKILHSSECDAENNPLRSREQPTQKNPYRTPINRDLEDDRARAAVVKELRRQKYTKHAKRLEDCGAVIGVRHCLDCAHSQSVKSRCDLWQMCPTCCRRRGRVLAAELMKHKKLVETDPNTGKRPPHQKKWIWRMITLPVKNMHDPQHDLKRLGRSFAKLWRSFLGKQPGTAAFRSIEFGALNGTVHMHVLYYGPWVSQRKLSARWLKLTGDSFVTDVRAIDDRKGKGVKEVAKYAVKLFAVPPAKVIKFWREIRGKHCTQRYGALRGLRPKPQKDENGNRIEKEFYLDCEMCGSIRYHYTAVDAAGNIKNLDKKGFP